MGNSASLLRDIDPADHGLAIEKPLKEDEPLNILGIFWIPIQDTYRFRIQLLEKSVLTKRSVLFLIARLYDPLGWISPVAIIAKSFMQKLCLKSLETAQPQVSAFSDETGGESTELGLPLEPVDSHETRTKKLRGLIMYPLHNQ